MLSLTEYGLYFRKGNPFIDLWKPVDYAVITRANPIKPGRVILTT